MRYLSWENNDVFIMGISNGVFIMGKSEYVFIKKKI